LLHKAQECWVTIFLERLGARVFMEGVETMHLAADYEAATGKTRTILGAK
jgi:hypothetical protein